MTDLQVDHLPDPVHRELPRRAAQAGMTVRDYVLDLIRREQELPSRHAALSVLPPHRCFAAASGFCVPVTLLAA